MKSIRASGLVAAALVAVLALAGCGERPQVVVYKQGKYQGKPDTPPWQADPGAAVYTPQKWTKGDATSWENAVKQRNQNQNEYARAE